MNDNIFGYSFDELRRMQQGEKVGKIIDTSTSGKKPATPKDKALLETKGIQWLRDEGMLGVLDRLNLL